MSLIIVRLTKPCARSDSLTIRSYSSNSCVASSTGTKITVCVEQARPTIVDLPYRTLPDIPFDFALHLDLLPPEFCSCTDLCVCYHARCMVVQSFPPTTPRPNRIRPYIIKRLRAFFGPPQDGCRKIVSSAVPGVTQDRCTHLPATVSSFEDLNHHENRSLAFENLDLSCRNLLESFVSGDGHIADIERDSVESLNII